MRAGIGQVAAGAVGVAEAEPDPPPDLRCPGSDLPVAELAQYRVPFLYVRPGGVVAPLMLLDERHGHPGVRLTAPVAGASPEFRRL
ncbi:MAG: hypothetical protein M5U09_02780, partial [Gammaproteobacteria bacterium]|nr:hypothetical protein [Gammaproteobacteria bacterium]